MEGLFKAVLQMGLGEALLQLRRRREAADAFAAASEEIAAERGVPADEMDTAVSADGELLTAVSTRAQSKMSWCWKRRPRCPRS